MTTAPTANYDDFLADSLHISNYIARVHYVDPSDDSTGIFYWTLRTFGTRETDTPASQRFDRRIKEGYDFVSNSGSSEAGIGTITGLLPSRDGGVLTIVQVLGDLDYLSALAFDGRQIEILHGGYSPLHGELPYSDYKEVFNGVCGGQPIIGLDEVTFQLNPKEVIFEHPIQTRRYHGGNWAYHFTGGGGQKVDCTNNAAFNFTSGPFTLQAWILPSDWLGAVDQRIFNRGVAGASGYDFGIDSALKVEFRTHQAGATQTTSTAAIDLNAGWTHIAVVRSGDAAIIYINGYDATATHGVHVDPVTYAGSLILAANSTGAEPYGGMLDEVKISNVALARNYIFTTMNRSLTPTEIASAYGGYVGYWNFDDGTGLTVNDLSSTNADGTLDESTYWYSSGQGGEENEGSLLPDVWGARFGVPPVLVDATKHIYQMHSGPIQGIVGIFEGGSEISIDPIFPNSVDYWVLVAASTPAPGTYLWASTPYGSYFRLGSAPSLPITVDLQGDKSGGVYRSTAADIVRYIVCNRGPQPLVDPTGLDTASFDALATAAPQAVGMDYDSETPIIDVINFLLNSVGAPAWFKRDGGKMKVARFSGVLALTSEMTLDETDIEMSTLEPLDAGSPIWAVDIGWKKNSLVHSTSDIAGAVIGTPRNAFLLKEWRIVGDDNILIRERYPGARKMTLETGLGLWVDARAEASRKLVLFSEVPQAFKMFTKERLTQLDRFDCVVFYIQDKTAAGPMQYRLSTTATSKFIVLSIADDTAKGGTMLTLYREETDEMVDS